MAEAFVPWNARHWGNDVFLPDAHFRRKGGHCIICRVKPIVAIAGLGGFLYGVDFGVIAAAEPYLMALGICSGTRVSLVVGAVMLGGLLSSLTAGILCDWLGRKKMIVSAAAMFMLAIPVVCLSLGSSPVLLAGRVLQGMSAGYMAVVMPMYITETLPPAVRGRGTGVFQFFLGLGLVIAAGAGCLVATCYGASDTEGLDVAGKMAAWRTTGRATAPSAASASSTTTATRCRAT